MPAMQLDFFKPHFWFSRRLADVAVIEEAGSPRQRNDLQTQTPQRHGAGGRSMGPSRSAPFHGPLLSLRRCALLLATRCVPRAFGHTTRLLFGRRSRMLG